MPPHKTAYPDKQGSWRQEPYCWLILSILLLAVVSGLITFWLAHASYDGLVVDDYYRRGLEINRTLARDRAAERYGLRAIVETDEKQENIRITLQGNHLFSQPERITVQLLHPTRGGHDKKLLLEGEGSGVFRGALPPLVRGDWYVLVEARDWRAFDYLFVAAATRQGAGPGNP